MNEPADRAVPDQVEERDDAALPSGMTPLLTAGQAATFLSCSRSHVDRLVVSGMPYLDLTPTGSDRVVRRFNVSEIQAWAVRHRNGAGA